MKYTKIKAARCGVYFSWFHFVSCYFFSFVVLYVFVLYLFIYYHENRTRSAHKQKQMKIHTKVGSTQSIIYKFFKKWKKKNQSVHRKLTRSDDDDTLWDAVARNKCSEERCVRRSSDCASFTAARSKHQLGLKLSALALNQRALVKVSPAMWSAALPA